jgi:hypothetical protein
MPDQANTQSEAFEFQREQAGRYEVYLTSPRTRLGLLMGKPGNWLAEDPSGRVISAYNTRTDGAKALLNAARTQRS